MTQAEKSYRRMMKKFYRYTTNGRMNNESHTPVSLQDDWHCISRKDECDGWFEYGLFNDQPELSLEELHKLAYESFGRPYKPTYYDCTGQVFTQYISVHRNPCGFVSVIHRLAIDC